MSIGNDVAVAITDDFEGLMAAFTPCMKRCSYCGRENDAARSACQECGTRLPDTESSVASAVPQSAVVCPVCGAHDYKAALALRGSFNWLVFFLGGFIAVIFHNASRQRRMQCNACGEFFDIRTALSKTSLIVLWLLIAPTIIILAFGLIVGLFSK
jgi:hypothetical protein